MLSLKKHKVFWGPSPFAREPSVVLTLSVQPAAFDGIERHIAHLSDLTRSWFNGCPEDEDGLRRIAQFVTQWSAALLNEMSGNLKCNFSLSENTDIFLVIGFHHPRVSVRAVELCCSFLTSGERLTPDNLDRALQSFWRLCERHHPDWQAQFLIDYCAQNEIPYFRFAARYWQFGWGKKSSVFFESQPMSDSSLGVRWGSNKLFAKQIFAQMGAPVVKHAIVNSIPALKNAVNEVGFPCVIKPTDSSRSRGVTTNIDSEEKLLEAYRQATQISKSIMLEQHIPGQLHRIMVVRGKLWRIIVREQPYVIGDGKQSVLALTHDYNMRIDATASPGSFIGSIPIDVDFDQVLKRAGYDRTSVPRAGTKVYLQDIPLLSRGSQYTDVTNVAHPEIRMMSEMIAQKFGIDNCGLDFITQDISQPVRVSGGAFIEVNSTPGLRVPFMAGVNAEEIGRVTLGDLPGRIPVTLIIAEASHLESIMPCLKRDPNSGWFCNNQIGIGEVELANNNSTVFSAVRSLLANTLLHSAAVVLTPSELQTHGLPVDRVSVTVLYQAPEFDSGWNEVVNDASSHVVEANDIDALVAHITP